MKSFRIIGTGSALFILYPLSFILCISGCASNPTELEDYHPEPILFAYLFAGEPVEEVYLERVASLYNQYESADHGIHGATIRLRELGGNDTLYFMEDSLTNGRYIPAAGDSLIPQPLKNYLIEAWTPFGEYLQSTALVPGHIDQYAPLQIFLEDELGNRYAVNDGDTLNRNMPNMTWVWGDVVAAGGFMGLLVNETHRDSLVPLDPGWDPTDPADTLEEFEKSRLSWTFMRDDQRTIKIFWIAFQFEGWHRVELQAISREYYSYLYSTFRAQQGFGGDYEYNIRGGLGVFGAASRRSMRIYIEKVE